MGAGMAGTGTGNSEGKRRWKKATIMWKKNITSDDRDDRLRGGGNVTNLQKLDQIRRWSGE